MKSNNFGHKQEAEESQTGITWNWCLSGISDEKCNRGG